MSDQKDAWYEVTLATQSLKSYRVRAAFVTIDERLFPGYTQLRSESNVLVALVRSEMVAFIQRLDEGSGAPAVKPSPPTGPSPASVPPFRPPSSPPVGAAYTTTSPRT